LNHVVGRENPPGARSDAGTVHKRAVETVQIFEFHDAVVQVDNRVLAARPDAVDGLLVFEIILVRPFRTSWLIVGNVVLVFEADRALKAGAANPFSLQTEEQPAE
jgi:hypothetical protein